ncbi:molybdenum cofactor guanylyltransferase [Paludisphaera soli]|uniref:molybdenum cofactor guanylyltransferase n=1 Tax=Paludisphaera soli TaxID=2712865 RepID=UPI0021BC4BF8|nr:molybdenum cofactor guanylyltransferase [Paludisphaera soli]
MVEVAAIVLCGGESRRMGTCKADLPFGPETLLQRSVRLIGGVARPLVVAAAHDQPIPPLPAFAIVARDPPSRRGPLQGLASGLAALGRDVDLVYLASVDAPFFKPRWLETLVATIGDHDAVVAVIEGRIDPLNALYRAAPTRSAVEGLLGRGQLRASTLFDCLNTRAVADSELRRLDPDGRALANLNTPEDYRRALDLLEGRAPSS